MKKLVRLFASPMGIVVVGVVVSVVLATGMTVFNQLGIDLSQGSAAALPSVTLTPGKTLAAIGEEVTVSWKVTAGTTTSKDWIAFVPRGTQWKSTDVSNNGRTYTYPWFWTSGAVSGTGVKDMAKKDFGDLDLNLALVNIVIPYRVYQDRVTEMEFVYYSNGGYTEVARSAPVKIIPHKISLVPTKDMVKASEPVGVRWDIEQGTYFPPKSVDSNKNGFIFTDWIGLVPKGKQWRDYSATGVVDPPYADKVNLKPWFWTGDVLAGLGVTDYNANNGRKGTPIILPPEEVLKGVTEFEFVYYFHYYEMARSKPVRLVTLTCDGNLDFMLTLDRSGSMLSLETDGRTKLEWAKDGILAFIDTVDKAEKTGTVRIGIDSFGGLGDDIASAPGRSTLDSPLTSNYAYLRDKVKSINYGKTYTCIQCGIRIANRQLELSQAKITSDILLSDGQANRIWNGTAPGDTKSKQAAILEAKDGRADGNLYYAIGYGKDVDATTLTYIAGATSRYFYKPDVKTWNQTYTDLAKTLCTMSGDIPN